jgi:hypothetical protein
MAGCFPHQGAVPGVEFSNGMVIVFMCELLYKLNGGVRNGRIQSGQLHRFTRRQFGQIGIGNFVAFSR